jgi:hypothetical protein
MARVFDNFLPRWQAEDNYEYTKNLNLVVKLVVIKLVTKKKFKLVRQARNLGLMNYIAMNLHIKS